MNRKRAVLRLTFLDEFPRFVAVRKIAPIPEAKLLIPAVCSLRWDELEEDDQTGHDGWQVESVAQQAVGLGTLDVPSCGGIVLHDRGRRYAESLGALVWL